MEDQITNFTRLNFVTRIADEEHNMGKNPDESLRGEKKNKTENSRVFLNKKKC